MRECGRHGIYFLFGKTCQTFSFEPQRLAYVRVVGWPFSRRRCKLSPWPILKRVASGNPMQPQSYKYSLVLRNSYPLSSAVVVPGIWGGGGIPTNRQGKLEGWDRRVAFFKTHTHTHTHFSSPISRLQCPGWYRWRVVAMNRNISVDRQARILGCQPHNAAIDGRTWLDGEPVKESRIHLRQPSCTRYRLRWVVKPQTLDCSARSHTSPAPPADGNANAR